jgi:outer membrane lipoprotein LolB
MAPSSRFIRDCRLAGVVLSSLFVGACAVLPSTSAIAPPARAGLDAFSLEGRFSLHNENKNYSGRLSWRHRGSNNTLLISSPFGQGMAEITTGESSARLTTSDGKLYTAVDAETLTQQVLGYPLPLARLTDWVRGRDTMAGLSERDLQGRPLRLSYADWRVEYGYEGDDPQAPPSRIFADRSGGLELRLKIDEWNSLAP